MHPFVKWAGGKTQLLDKLHELMPKNTIITMSPSSAGELCFSALLLKISL